MALFGDSLTEQGGTLPGGTSASADIRSFAPWAHGNVLLGQVFTIAGIFGIGGQTATQIRARIADVLAVKPGWVHLLAGTNDMGLPTALPQ